MTPEERLLVDIFGNEEARIAAARAEAWDEGFNAGFEVSRIVASSDEQLGDFGRNPYRTDSRFRPAAPSEGDE